jgi:hypothetical protein
MTQGGGGQKEAKKYHELFDWPLIKKILIFAKQISFLEQLF